MAEIRREERHGTRIVEAIDDPGSGNAHHEYTILHKVEGKGTNTLATIKFQNGPILEVGNNGVHNEDLLAIVAHRLKCFQTSPFACKENGDALSHVNQALGVLAMRTSRRVAAGIEGTHTAEVPQPPNDKPEVRRTTTTHPAVTAMLQFFEYGHLPPHLQTASRPFCELAKAIAAGPQNAETTVALRKLLEAKDAAVRAVIFKG